MLRDGESKRQIKGEYSAGSLGIKCETCSTCPLTFVRASKLPYSVPHSVLLSALPGNIYLHKLDQEIGRIRQKYEIPIVQRIRSVLLKTSRILCETFLSFRLAPSFEIRGPVP